MLYILTHPRKWASGMWQAEGDLAGRQPRKWTHYSQDTHPLWQGDHWRLNIIIACCTNSPGLLRVKWKTKGWKRECVVILLLSDMPYFTDTFPAIIQSRASVISLNLSFGCSQQNHIFFLEENKSGNVSQGFFCQRVTLFTCIYSCPPSFEPKWNVNILVWGSTHEAQS